MYTVYQQTAQVKAIKNFSARGFLGRFREILQGMFDKRRFVGILYTERGHGNTHRLRPIPPPPFFFEGAKD
ncbi:hypothetical protein, partial [Macromonas nakdongensis]|uniref:hypothetical protein n=1 Tax=Macromonas nakdongensis TaxID=1843082 RepID=UPI001E3C3CD6